MCLSVSRSLSLLGYEEHSGHILFSRVRLNELESHPHRVTATQLMVDNVCVANGDFQKIIEDLSE